MLISRWYWLIVNLLFKYLKTCNCIISGVTRGTERPGHKNTNQVQNKSTETMIAHKNQECNQVLNVECRNIISHIWYRKWVNKFHSEVSFWDISWPCDSFKSNLYWRVMVLNATYSHIQLYWWRKQENP